MRIVPFEMEHLEQIDTTKTNNTPAEVFVVKKHYIVCGKTALDGDRVIGIGGVSLTGNYAVAFLMITDEVRERPLQFVKESRKFLKEVDDEGYEIIAAAHKKRERRFMEYLGFKKSGTFTNNNIELTRYRYASSNTI